MYNDSILTKPPLHLEVLFISLLMLISVIFLECTYWIIFRVAPA